MFKHSNLRLFYLFFFSVGVSFVALFNRLRAVSAPANLSALIPSYFYRYAVGICASLPPFCAPKPQRDPAAAAAASMAAPLSLRATAEAMLVLVGEIATVGADLASAASPGSLGANCLRLSRKISLLSHFFEEIRDFAVRSGDSAQLPPAPYEASSSAPRQPDSFSCLTDLLMALEAAKRCLLICQRAKHDSASFVSPSYLY